ncbi:unnamed protein product [Mytilus edulis]|uniref:Uncharacterized protein n=1 Tax=Mytilus edulis TaxID=6550 RepID=A0A8S3STE3_MYTED|nr:unnamed protein product [Mytilus edulis]
MHLELIEKSVEAYSDPEPKLTGVKPIFIKESDFFGNKSPPKELWITHVEIYKALEHKIKPQFVRGIQRIKQMWRIYLDTEEDRMLLLTEGITLRNKTIPLHSQIPYYQKDEWLTTTIRVKNIPLSADDGQIDRELRQKNIDVISINRERLRVDNLVTHCWTCDRIVLYKKFDKPLSRFLTIANVKGLRDKQKRLRFYQWIKNQKCKITFIQETHFNTSLENALTIESDHSCYYSHGTTSSRGVAILINNKLDYKLIDEHKDLEGRIIMINIEFENIIYSLINIYAPNIESERNSFYKKLKMTFET